MGERECNWIMISKEGKCWRRFFSVFILLTPRFISHPLNSFPQRGMKNWGVQWKHRISSSETGEKYICSHLFTEPRNNCNGKREFVSFNCLRVQNGAGKSWAMWTLLRPVIGVCLMYKLCEASEGNQIAKVAKSPAGSWCCAVNSSLIKGNKRALLNQTESSILF